jgi:hypothetical protein
MAIAALILTGLSELLWIVSSVWVDAFRGYHFRVFLWIVRLGSFTGPVGMLGSLFGKGTLRWPAFSLSVVMTLLWIHTGSALDL